MATPKRRWVPIVAGLAAVVVLLGIAAAAISLSWLRDHATLEHDVATAQAASAFAAALARFPDPRPALEVGADRRPRPAPGPLRKNPGDVTAIEIVAWDPEEHALARATLPLWLVRLKSGPITFGAYASGIDDHGVRLTADEVVKMGRGVVMDVTTAEGARVLLSAQ